MYADSQNKGESQQYILTIEPLARFFWRLQCNRLRWKREKKAQVVPCCFKKIIVASTMQQNQIVLILQQHCSNKFQYDFNPIPATHFLQQSEIFWSFLNSVYILIWPSFTHTLWKLIMTTTENMDDKIKLPKFP